MSMASSNIPGRCLPEGRGYATPSGNFTASSMNEVWYSKQWDNAPMPNSIFFTKEGHAIHGSYETKKLGRAVSHGCVRLAPENAKILYSLVEEQGLGNTKVVLTGVTPGGEAKVASQAPSKNRNRQAEWYYPRDYSYPPRPQARPFWASLVWRSLLRRASGLLQTTTRLLSSARISALRRVMQI